MARPSAGLCDSCLHQRIVRTTRGSAFSLCERSRQDPSYPPPAAGAALSRARAAARGARPYLICDAASALEILPWQSRDFGPGPLSVRTTSKLVTAWNGVGTPLFWAREMRRR